MNAPTHDRTAETPPPHADSLGGRGRLKVVHLEDSEFDAAAVGQQLRHAGWLPEIQVVQTRPAFMQALRSVTPDVVLVDNVMPDFDGLSALELARVICPQVPVLFVTGTMTEQSVIEVFQRGASGCVLKQNAESLVPSVERAVREAAERTAQQSAAARLRASEELLQRVMDSSHDCIKLLDLDGRLLWMNACGLRVMELESFQQVENALWLDFWQGEDYRAACAAVQAAKERSVGTFTGFCPTSKGTPKWWDVVITPILDAAGQPEKLLATSRDTTERKLAEAALRESEAHLRNLVQALPAAVYTCDAEGRVTFFNEAAATLWGRRPELGKEQWCGAWKLYRTDGRPLPLEDCPMAVTLREGRAVRGEEILAERPDGSRANVQPYPTPMRDSRGVLTGAVNMLVDITEQRAMEESVRGSHTLYTSLVESLPQSIFRKDRAGRFTFANQRLCLTLGLPLADVLGRTDADLFAPELAAKYRADDLRVMETGLPYEGEEEVQGGQAKLRHVAVGKTALLDGEGRVVGIQGVFTDITERKQAETARAQRTAELERFHRLSVGRELQMIELKQEINELAKLAGRTPPYAASSLGTKPTPQP